jgi:hypothetical protein
MPSADLLFHSKRVYDDGAIVELKIWLLESPVPGSNHTLKYSLFYGERGARVVGYDNERGKGDHRHYGDREEPYAFTSVDQLVADFEADVAKVRGGAI